MTAKVTPERLALLPVEEYTSPLDGVRPDRRTLVPYLRSFFPTGANVPDEDLGTYLADLSQELIVRWLCSRRARDFFRADYWKKKRLPSPHSTGTKDFFEPSASFQKQAVELIRFCSRRRIKLSQAEAQESIARLMRLGVLLRGVKQ